MQQKVVDNEAEKVPDELENRANSYGPWMLVSYGRNERNVYAGNMGKRGFLGNNMDKGGFNIKAQGGKASMGSKVTRAAEGGINKVFDNYRKKNSTFKKGDIASLDMEKGSRFDILSDNLEEDNKMLFERKCKGNKPLQMARDGVIAMLVRRCLLISRMGSRALRRVLMLLIKPNLSSKSSKKDKKTTTFVKCSSDSKRSGKAV
ncbi:hypothetical protein ACOSQ3_025540 [Xanthoceras sorbifolium]